jgi:small subunit ribosomal protein S20
MANHKSALKRMRQNNKRRLHNKFYATTTRTAIKKLRNLTSKQEAEGLFPKVISMIDKLAKIHVIHKNKASNLKSKLAVHINKL